MCAPMSEEQRNAIISMALRRTSPDDVLRVFGVSDGRVLGLRLLREAVARRDGEGVELALIVSFTFGWMPEHLGVLLGLEPAVWHQSHEDVVSALGTFKSPVAVDALVHATQWVPDYLDFDEARALATKAVWALGGIAGDEAQAALVRLTQDPDPIVSDGAKYQLRRRSGQEE